MQKLPGLPTKRERTCYSQLTRHEILTCQGCTAPTCQTSCVSMIYDYRFTRCFPLTAPFLTLWQCEPKKCEGKRMLSSRMFRPVPRQCVLFKGSISSARKWYVIFSRALRQRRSDELVENRLCQRILQCHCQAPRHICCAHRWRWAQWRLNRPPKIRF